MNTTYTHQYEREHPTCECTYGLPGIKESCPEHGRLVRSTDDRSERAQSASDEQIARNAAHRLLHSNADRRWDFVVDVIRDAITAARGVQPAAPHGFVETQGYDKGETRYMPAAKQKVAPASAQELQKHPLWRNQLPPDYPHDEILPAPEKPEATWEQLPKEIREYYENIETECGRLRLAASASPSGESDDTKIVDFLERRFIRNVPATTKSVYFSANGDVTLRDAALAAMEFSNGKVGA